MGFCWLKLERSAAVVYLCTAGSLSFQCSSAEQNLVMFLSCQGFGCFVTLNNLIAVESYMYFAIEPSYSEYSKSVVFAIICSV